MFGTIPGDPIAANRPEKVAETERVQREDRKGRSAGERRRQSRKQSGQTPSGQDQLDQAPAPERPDQFGKRIDLEA
jgi:hypothetical protein